MLKHTLISLVFLSFGLTSAGAEITTASPDHFTLKLEATSPLSPEEVWHKLIDPSQWWDSDHTYSGDAQNLSLDLRAGGLWAEDWSDGSVAHGQVLYVSPNRVLRLEAPFGPLQGKAINAVWTISLQQADEGTLIIFDFIANGTDNSGLDELAAAVDFVKSAAIESLANSGAGD